jgi:hypothetical protein
MQAMMAYIEAFPDAWNAVAEAADDEVAAAIQAVQGQNRSPHRPVQSLSAARSC